MPDDIIPIEEFCEKVKKTPRQVRRLWGIHAGLKQQVKGEKSARVNYSLWQRILEDPRGYVKLTKK